MKKTIPDYSSVFRAERAAAAASTVSGRCGRRTTPGGRVAARQRPALPPLAAWLCGAAGLLAAPVWAQPVAETHGARLDMKARNVFWQQNYRDGSPASREWGQGLILDFSSGDTPGRVGLGVEASVYASAKLDQRNWAAARAGVLARDGDDLRNASAWAGGAVRLRAWGSELRYGSNLRPYNPVFAPADTRLLPSTATGWWLSSRALAETLFEAGHFTAGKDYSSHRSRREFYASYAGVSTDRVSFVGTSHALGDSTSVMLYASQYHDIWRQYFAHASHAWTLGERRLSMDVNLYRTRDQGRKLAGDIDVTAWSLALGHSLGAHTVKLSYQQVKGAQPADYLSMAPGSYHDSIYLSNSSLLSDFNGPGEKSWGVLYDLDMARYGTPGLTLHARYVRGHGADGSAMRPDSPYAYYGSNEKHWTAEVDLRYEMQSGRAKGLSARLRFGVHRMLQGTSNVSSRQVRLYLEYPYSVF